MSPRKTLINEPEDALGRARLREEAIRGIKPEGPTYADPQDVREFAASLPEKFLLCRELQHNWLPFGTPAMFRDGGYQRVLRCNRCKTERHMELDAFGMVIRSYYEHPEGYLAEGLGRIVGESRGVLRLASLTRLIEKGGEAKLIDRPEPKKKVEPPAPTKTRAPIKKTVTKKTPAKTKPPAGKKTTTKKTATAGRK